jgi:hypothetical protein
MPEPPPHSPIQAEVSLSELIDREGFEASLITTFNANLPFYEEFVLRRLQAKNCRQNFVLMDAAQCAFAWRSEASRPRYAGFEYTLIPMHAKGAFHPKIVFLLGPKKSAISVGSHNLTLSGFGINREVTGLVEFSNADPKDAQFIRSALSQISRWILNEGAHTPSELIDFALELSRLIPETVRAINEETAPRFLAQSDLQSSLFSALQNSISFVPRRITVVGAFFDSELAFLMRLRSVWPLADITVGVDPSSVYLPNLIQDRKVAFVDASQALNSSPHHYLHAKAVYFEGERPEDAVWLSGSANPSAPGWGLYAPNVEAVVLVRGALARSTATELGVLKLFDLDELSREALEIVVSRTAAEHQAAGDQPELLLVGIASERDPQIIIDLSLTRASWVQEVTNSDSWSVQTEEPSKDPVPVELLAAIHEDQRLILHFSTTPRTIRSLELYRNGDFVARVLVHHPAIVRKQSSSSTQRQVRDAIGALDSGSADLSSLIAMVSKVIFSVSTEKLLSGTDGQSRAHKNDGEEREISRPESLEMAFPASREKRKKARMLSHGDLVELIDALIHKLYVAPLVSVEQTADGTGGPEDGNGNGAEGNSLEPNEPQQELSDAVIAAAVKSKAKTLMNRMISRQKAVLVEAANKETSSEFSVSAAAKTIVMQLTAVIALLRELRRIENSGRWSAKGLKLLDKTWLIRLFEASMQYLFAKDKGLAMRAQSGIESYAELDDLYVLLTWLAWVCGFDFRAPVRPRWNLGAVEHTFQLHGNGYLTRLMPLVVESESVDQLWAGIENSISRSAIAKAEAHEWLSRNARHGEKLLDVLTAPSTKLMTPKRKLAEGDLAWFPGLGDHLVVITEINDASLKLWDFEREQGYSASFVRTYIP